MRCQRCSGLMVYEQFEDFADDTGHIGFDGWRCVNCGAIHDHLVQKHRQTPYHKPYGSQRRWTDFPVV